MKLPFNDYQKIQKMSYNEFNRWFKELSHGLIQEGVQQSESELDNATVEQWQTFIDKTPGTSDIFSIWDYDNLKMNLSKEFSQGNVDRIMRIITRGGKDE